MILTVKQLSQLCDEAISKGCGNKKVLISIDDEGNDFHPLFYGFTTKAEDIKMIAESCYFGDEYDLNDIVLLG